MVLLHVSNTKVLYMTALILKQEKDIKRYDGAAGAMPVVFFNLALLGGIWCGALCQSYNPRGENLKLCFMLYLLCAGGGT